MRNHEPRFHSRPLRKKCRKTFALIWIHKAIRAAFAYVHQIDDRDRGVIERKRKRRSVKIPARNHLALTGVTVPGYSEYERIIRR